MSIEVAVTDEGGARVVKVSGDVDLDSSPQLWSKLQAALKNAPLVKVHLADVAYIDSSGVAVLIQGLKHAAKSGADYRLLDPSPRVMGVLELAQLPQLFRIERSDPEA